MTQEYRPRLTCNDGCSISVQASRTHYSTPREDHPDWHWSRFECVEVGYPEDAQGTRIAMPDDWLGYADNPSAGLRSDVFAWVPVQLVCEWIQAHGGLTSAEPWFEQEPFNYGGENLDNHEIDVLLDDCRTACADIYPQVNKLREELIRLRDHGADRKHTESAYCALALLNQALRTVDAVQEELNLLY
jgi:hypothetical protein